MKWYKLLSSLLPKMVIAFRTSGCMDQHREFLFIGYVKNSWTHGNVDYHWVQPLVKGPNEHRDSSLPYERVWQLQHLGANLYIHYR